MPKYVFVTGGVTSSLGKGITAASIGLSPDRTQVEALFLTKADLNKLK